MPSQKFPFITGLPYHVYNRGFQKQRIFFNDRDYVRFLQGVEYYLPQYPTVSLHAFCLLPNHFHFVLSAQTEEDREGFMRKIQQSYAMYLKTKYPEEIPRGQLFEWRYNARPIEDEAYLSRCMSYVCYNAIKHELVTDIRDWQWTSYHELVEGVVEPFLPRIVLLDNINIGEYLDIDEEE